MIESELLFTQVLGCDRVSLYLNKDKRLTSDQARFISSSLEKRIKGEPLQYILGKTEFMGLEFRVNKKVLIPRPETETLVEAAIKYAKGKKILDLGTGSGCIAVSIAKKSPGSDVTAVDISKDALDIAKENAELNRVKVRFLRTKLFKGLLTKYDLIISNPPYIPRDQIRSLQPELKYEPFIALDGGNDGLAFYRKIIKEAPDYLKDNGILIMEMGFNQRKWIEGILRRVKHFNIIEVIKDYNNIDRVIVVQKGRRNG
jgi:release factor glutamine methyltransferase